MSLLQRDRPDLSPGPLRLSAPRCQRPPLLRIPCARAAVHTQCVRCHAGVPPTCRPVWEPVRCPCHCKAL
eukprot:4077777-Pyramimonas_sp.AAC.1